MDDPKQIPDRMLELSPEMRRFLAGMRPHEMAKLRYFVEKFSQDDLETIEENLETLRVARRMGRLSMWLFGFIAAGVGAATAVKVFIIGGGK